jgi:hypothetical protein
MVINSFFNGFLWLGSFDAALDARRKIPDRGNDRDRLRFCVARQGATPGRESVKSQAST